MLLGQLFSYGLNNFTLKDVVHKRESKKPIALTSSQASSSIVVVLFAEVSSCKD